MNDETPEIPPEGSMIYMQMPPEVRQMLEHQRMHAEENAHTTLRFLRSLDEEQLRAFRGVLSAVSVTDDTVPYYMGLVGGLLHEKFGVCLGCGNKHDDELAHMAGAGPFPFDVEKEAAKADEVHENWQEQYDIDCAAYAVTPLVAGDPDSMVLCTGPCQSAGGTRGTWDNIEARKERKAGTGGCDFCANIQKWG